LINSTRGWHDQQVGDIFDAHNYPGPVSPKAEACRGAVLGEFGGLALKVSNEADVEIYLNGVLAARLAGRNSDYEELDLTPEAERALRVGSNIIAVRCRQSKPGHYIDVGLVREQQK
jgi:hypothetical protein